MSKRVLVVCRSFWPEDSRLNELCIKLVDLGMKVDVLCGQPSNENGVFFKGYNSFRVRREIYNKINIYRSIDIKKGIDSNIGLFINYTFFPLLSLFLVNKLNRNKYESVFIYQISPVFSGIAGLKIAKRQKIPVYMRVIDLWPEYIYRELDIHSKILKAVFSGLSDRIYRRADKLIVQSEKMRRYFSERLAKPDTDLPVVSLSPDSMFASEMKDNDLLEKTAGSFNCVMIGDFEGWMSPKVIVQIVEKLKKSQIKTIRFIVVGTGNEIDNLDNLVHENNLYDYFFFEGYVEKKDYGRYINLADALIAVLKVGKMNEYSIPQQIVDYMSAGKALLLSMNGSAKEAVRKEKMGFVSEADDAEALYGNLIKLYSLDDTERTAMGLRARRYQQEYFNSDLNAEKIYRILSGEYTDDDETDRPDIKRLWNLE